MFTATVLTMFPEAFPGPLGVSLIGTAWRARNLWSLETVDIRDFSTDKRGFLDDTPAGGGPGQVLKADVVAKAALEAAVRYAARDLGPRGIRVNALSPGAMKTLSLAGISGGRGMIAQGRAMSAMKEDTSMEGVAGCALWLCSDLGLSTTGEIIHVDAGFHMMGLAADEEG